MYFNVVYCEWQQCRYGRTKFVSLFIWQTYLFSHFRSWEAVSYIRPRCYCEAGSQAAHCRLPHCIATIVALDGAHNKRSPVVAFIQLLWVPEYCKYNVPQENNNPRLRNYFHYYHTYLIYEMVITFKLTSLLQKNYKTVISIVHSYKRYCFETAPKLISEISVVVVFAKFKWNAGGKVGLPCSWSWHATPAVSW